MPDLFETFRDRINGIARSIAVDLINKAEVRNEKAALRRSLGTLATLDASNAAAWFEIAKQVSRLD